MKAWNPHRGDWVFLFALTTIEIYIRFSMGHLIASFLARGFKFTDLFWIGGGALAIFFFAIGIARWLHWIGKDYPVKRDPWNDEPWI